MYTNGSLIVEEATWRSVRRWLSVKGPHTSVYVKAGMIMLYLGDTRPPRGYGYVSASEWLKQQEDRSRNTDLRSSSPDCQERP